MDFDEIEVTNFTVDDGNFSFTLSNGTKFIRGETWDTSSSGSAFALSNDLLGTWQEYDGKSYVFDSNALLKINSDQYGYLVKGNELLTLGPLVDGTQAVLQEYRFNRSGNKLYLRCADDKKYTLTLSE
ncbi:MAG: hypothetical protein LBC52_03140 [Treponema sp.]|jgi:hypothetical protein|nr:hypothetical protein [Treponema sp.]